MGKGGGWVMEGVFSGGVASGMVPGFQASVNQHDIVVLDLGLDF